MTYSFCSMGLGWKIISKFPKRHTALITSNSHFNHLESLKGIFWWLPETHLIWRLRWKRPVQWKSEILMYTSIVSMKLNLGNYYVSLHGLSRSQANLQTCQTVTIRLWFPEDFLYHFRLIYDQWVPSLWTIDRKFNICQHFYQKWAAYCLLFKHWMQRLHSLVTDTHFASIVTWPK